MTNGEPRLGIDAAAAVQRLSAGELEGTWQVPAELARRAFRAGARRVAVDCDRRGFSVRDDGPPIDAATLDALDRVRRGVERERAIARIEAGPHAELRYLAALGGASVDVACGRGAAVVVQGLRWDRGRACEWLGSVGRFAGPAIELNGRSLPSDEPRGLAREPIDDPWHGDIVLSEAGDDGAIWLLTDRMVSAYLVVPGALPFEARVDLSSGGPWGNAAALRTAIEPAVEKLIDQAARMIRDVAQRAAELDPADARRLRVMLLKAARLPRWRGGALRAAAFPGRVRCRARWLSLADLGSAELAGADRRVATCLPADVQSTLFLDSTPAAVLEPAERSRLAQALGLRFWVLPKAEAARAERVRARTARLRGWLCRLVPLGRPLPDACLDAAEHGLIEALRRAGGAEGLDVRFRAGGGRPRRRGARITLPRKAAVVRAAVAAMARDPGWAFPAALALLSSLATDAARSSWRGLAGTRAELVPCPVPHERDHGLGAGTCLPGADARIESRG